VPENNAAWRRSNIGFLLFAATDRFLREKLSLVHADGFDWLTDAQLAFLLSIDPAGTRPTVIASRANLTKPSVAEQVTRAEAQGLVVRRASPDDKRAKIVTLTPLGKKALAAIRRAIAATEARFAGIVGADVTRDITHALGSYAAELAVAGSYEPLQRSAEWLGESIARVLPMAARRFVREVLETVHREGHRDVGELLLSLIRNLDIAGTRLTELAERAHITKQSMREIVDRAEELQLVTRAPDPNDYRAKIIRFTPSGLSMLDDMRRGVEASEQSLEARFGKPLHSAIRDGLMRYIVDGQRQRLG
jgi:DNA-binding MarR family transcriptional regulator